MANSRNSEIADPYPGLLGLQPASAGHGTGNNTGDDRRIALTRADDIRGLAGSPIDQQLYKIFYIVLVGTVGLIHLLYKGDDFADHFSYLFFLDRLTFLEGPDSLLLEPFSKGILIGLRVLTGNTAAAVDWAHYVISAIYLIGTVVIFPPREGNWRGMLVTFAIFGPQLAFITLRATGAYFFVAAGTLLVLHGYIRGLWIGAIGMLFHVSAALALPPILALIVVRRSPRLSWLQRPVVLIGLAAASITAFASLNALIMGGAQSLFEAVPYLSKYMAFVRDDSNSNNDSFTEFAMAHYIFLVAISLFIVTFLAVSDRRGRMANVFVFVSYCIYLFIFFGFSPIAAFRQTAFWLIPAAAIFPWQRIGWRGIGTPIFCLATAGIFLFQFSRVLAL